MAASRDQDDAQSPRPSRSHRIPGHLEDYELSYRTRGPRLSPNLTEEVMMAPSNSHYTRRPDVEEIRWRRMEDCLINIQHQMRSLQVTVAESRDLNKRVQRLEQLTPPVPKGPLMEVEPMASAVSTPNPTEREPKSIQEGERITEPVLVMSAPLALLPGTSTAPVGPPTELSMERSASAPRFTSPCPDYLLTPVHPATPAPPAVASTAAPPAIQMSGPPVPSQTPQPDPPLVAQPATMQPSTAKEDVTRGFQPWIPPLRPLPQQPRYASFQPVLAAQGLRPPPGMFPAVNHTSSEPSMLEMVIASSYGLPKPKLTVFSSGKESDFALLKKGLDSVLGPHKHLSEDYKYQILLDHLKFPSAFQVAKRYIHDPTPYTSAMRALEQKYGQPRQLVQSELSAILCTPHIKPGDSQAFEAFSLSVASLVGMLTTMDGVAESELHCGSHVDRLLTKLPLSYRDNFAEYCLNRGILRPGSNRTYTLYDLAEWLERKTQAMQVSRRATELYASEKPWLEGKVSRHLETKPKPKLASVYYGPETTATKPPALAHPGPKNVAMQKKRERFKPYCPFCEGTEHYLSGCNEFSRLDVAAVVNWIRDKNKCWRCGRNHSADNCTLKKPCSTCGEQHLLVLHGLAKAKEQNPSILTMCTASSVIYVDHSSHSGRVMLKVVRVQLHNGKKTMDTYAVLDDGSERTIILPAAVKFLGLAPTDETLALRTIRQDVLQLHGGSLSLEVSTKAKPKVRHQILNAFTAEQLALAEQSCPVETLKRKYSHLQRLPLTGFSKVKPMILIGSDHPHLITPVCPVIRGPPGGPVAVCTELGWALQGPAKSLPHPAAGQACLHSSFIPQTSELSKDVERLWQLDVLPFRNEKEVTRSKEDQQAIDILESRTVRVQVEGVHRYATPLLRRAGFPQVKAPEGAVMALLRANERRLRKDPSRAQTYNEEIKKLEKAGYVVKLTPEEVHGSTESWYIPHHLVHHNNKARLVFNCSFLYQQTALNDLLLPGPTLSPSLLGVLIRFRQHAVAISGDIKAMFHQVRLLPEDQPLLRFLWRSGQQERPPDVYEWRVLPFGTTCSPCCATYALQRHVRDHREGNEEVYESVHTAFYVDNCLQSLPTPCQAKQLLDQMRQLLARGGFEIRQWASNVPEVVSHLPTAARSDSCELWLTFNQADPQESMLGLRWHCPTDTLGYKHRPVSYATPTLRNVYKVLASQYDPLGFIIPYTTRGKILVQSMWQKEMGWDEPITGVLRATWAEWEKELPYLQNITLPRCYVPPATDSPSCTFELHVFCDASEKAYGSVAYLRTTDCHGHASTSFLLARSRVAPRKRLSMPRLELSAALTGAQLAKTLQTELTIPLQNTILWTDSTTVLSWLQSDSCRYKVFVGTRIAEIQELTSSHQWRYVTSAENPADDITRGKELCSLSADSRWAQGPEFLQQSSAHWPSQPTGRAETTDELRKGRLCGLVTVAQTPTPDPGNFTSWEELVEATYYARHGAASPPMTAIDRVEAEIAILKSAQCDSFPEEVVALMKGRTLALNSRLCSLCPEYDQVTGLIRVGGRLRRAEGLDSDTIHPIVLPPEHPVTKLLVQHFDTILLHPGPERVFAEIRRAYWIIRGRQVIRRHQRQCAECQKWRGRPASTKMADLPAARLRIHKPAFWSTGVDCFGPYTIKIGRRHEKRWGIIFKCLTTRCVHLDLLPSLDSDAFLMAVRRFVSRRGTPFEIWSDQGTNFRGGARELQEAFSMMTPILQAQLAKQRIAFHCNPPHAPHFGGAWEREIRSVKGALQVILKNQIVTEEVLCTALLEVEGILNAKPLGYASSDIADPDPITPNLLLMGRRDASLPQVIYGPGHFITSRRWKQSQVRLS
ncbi:uncharacterized protein LOC109196100 [Oreochromis niloticus]|uniref:uncharacterized protein LOC109196100 n=1 Tax=Oreochromis niloticus TaxID=8128 RepID=UPI000905991A|nr:uncharacterized protein LOC109196100 [Oreochromis niloticus]